MAQGRKPLRHIVFCSNQWVMVIHYMLFVAVMDIILVFKRTSVGAYRIRPSCERKCMSAADMPDSVEGLFFSAKDVNSLF